LDPGYDSDNGLLSQDGPSPGNTPTNSQEARENKSLILDYKSTIDQVEYDLEQGRRAMHALHKNPEDLDTDDEIAMDEAYDDNISKPENMQNIAQTILAQSQIKENAERDLNIARTKLAKYYEESGTVPSPEPSLKSLGSERAPSEENRAPSDTFDDIYDATPLGSPRVPSNQDSSNVPIAESSEPVTLNPNTSESNHPELETETEVESTRKRKRDSVSDTEEVESTHKRKRDSNSDTEEAESSHKRKRDSNSDTEEAESSHKRKRDSNSDIEEVESTHKRKRDSVSDTEEGSSKRKR
jgi:hypothetical protein